MNNVRNFPVLVFFLSFFVFWVAAQAGIYCRNRLRPIREEEEKDLSTVMAATLTLLGLIIAFSFSMAIGRYDQRKNLEAEEANAIGTEYARATLLSDADASKVHELLKQYCAQRILFYETGDARTRRLQQIETETSRLETELWSTVRDAAGRQPTPTLALVVAGMNDVLNSRGYTQAAWWNRIPEAAWSLMAAIAVVCNFLIGYGAHRSGAMVFLVLPVALAISFFLISDIDAPHGGLIHVLPRNLVNVSESLP
jgi:hypothetical protein